MERRSDGEPGVVRQMSVDSMRPELVPIERPSRFPDPVSRVPRSMQVLLGAAVVAGSAAVRAAQQASRVGSPAAQTLLRPPLLAPRWHPQRMVDRLAERGQQELQLVRTEIERLSRLLVPRLVAAVLDQLDLTELVLQRVDLDRVAGALNVNAIAAQVDVNAIAAQVDLDAAAARINVDAVADRVDLQAIVDRLDLVGLARWLIDRIDLPEIIRESSGSMASEAVRGARMQSIAADETVARLVDRLLLRRRGRRTDAPGWLAPPPIGSTDGGAPAGHHGPPAPDIPDVPDIARVTDHPDRAANGYRDGSDSPDGPPR